MTAIKYIAYSNCRSCSWLLSIIMLITPEFLKQKAIISILTLHAIFHTLLMIYYWLRCEITQELQNFYHKYTKPPRLNISYTYILVFHQWWVCYLACCAIRHIILKLECNSDKHKWSLIWHAILMLQSSL